MAWGAPVVDEAVAMVAAWSEDMVVAEVRGCFSAILFRSWDRIGLPWVGPCSRSGDSLVLFFPEVLFRSTYKKRLHRATLDRIGYIFSCQ